MMRAILLAVVLGVMAAVGCGSESDLDAKCQAAYGPEAKLMVLMSGSECYCCNTPTTVPGECYRAGPLTEPTRDPSRFICE